MNNRVKNLRKLMAGIAICAICGTMGGNASMATAYASQGNNQNKNSSVIKVKEKKNNKKHENKANHSGKSWNQKMIQVENLSETEREVKVAIIDSGVNYSEDINVVERRNFIVDDECSILYEDFKGHGTAVAGIIGALDNEEGITGINPNVQIYSARVLDDDLQAPAERIIAAIEWAMEEDVDIINMSLGINMDVPALHQAVKDAYEQGILLVAAVGNDGSITYPAAYEEVIAVGSVDSCGVSVQGEAVSTIIELMAPGENILSSAIFDGVIGGSGTSLATAHVTGVASVLMEMNPDMPAEFIRALMDYSANLYGDKEVYGNGVVDLEYAISITPSFKKTYEKYLRKSNQNEVQRKKQQEKFWGEIIKKVPQNEKDVEVFYEEENVIGLWKENGHRDSVQYAANACTSYVSFTDYQIEIIIAGCKYPDKIPAMYGMNLHPYHGYVWRVKKIGNTTYYTESNYIANYIYLTKVAQQSGSTAGLSSVQGMRVNDYQIINNDFANGTVGGKSYAEAFTLMGIGNYSSSDMDNRKLFVYGIAMHLVGDIYAHNAWRKVIENNSYTMERIPHDITVNGLEYGDYCDRTEIFPTRYSVARQVIKSVLIHAYNSAEGDLLDFYISNSFYGSTDSNRFYLYKFLDYAQAVNPNNIYSTFYYADLLYNFSESSCDLSPKIGAVYYGGDL